MAEVEIVLIYSTFPDQQSAEATSRDLVASRLAACANILGGMRAIYEWDGEVQNEEEVAVLFKTLPSKQEELVKRLGQLHPYEIPAIIGFEASYVEARYRAWLKAQTST